MSWFKRSKLPAKAAVQVIHASTMRMEQWRNSPELVRYAQQLFSTPQFQTMLAILRNESPSSFGLAIGSTHDDQIAHAYKGTGYNLCLNNLEALAIEESRPEMLEATFEPEPGHPRN